ncbi:hypothetical protein GCM10007103_01960 [Salinimicrobium marinum]|uniref:TonB C-terminal domain-containing protein n=1 Tax=Salinimicrobium marinum TaxID=680283 RepID=A0A918VUD4_9FLAO|nr:energy transducer TonB [Salinimicrobium marinum]GHA24327.1 hypothetical protein GCM10007103_01960 [Salinimicrobium marinum]
MECKKNKQADLRRKSILFFQVGLILILFLALLAIEWKTYGNESVVSSKVHLDEFTEEEVPVTIMKEVTPPPPPRDIIEDVNVADDDEDVVETAINSTEADPGEIIEIEDIVEEEPEEKIEDYSFISVEEVPVFPGCEDFDTNDERKECMSRKINDFVNRKFDTTLGGELGLSGIHRIYVQFKIEPDGSVSIVGARGPHPKLEAEAIRVAGSLPEMQPGRQGGKAVGVLYSLPITFRVQN